MLNAKVIEKKPPVNSRQAHFGRRSASPSLTAAVKGNAAKAEKKTERTVRTVKSVLAHFPIATCCRPICSDRKYRRASYGLYIIFYGWVYGGRGSMNSAPSKNYEFDLCKPVRICGLSSRQPYSIKLGLPRHGPESFRGKGGLHRVAVNRSQSQRLGTRRTWLAGPVRPKK